MCVSYFFLTETLVCCVQCFCKLSGYYVHVCVSDISVSPPKGYTISEWKSRLVTSDIETECKSLCFDKQVCL